MLVAAIVAAYKRAREARARVHALFARSSITNIRFVLVSAAAARSTRLVDNKIRF